MQVLCQNQNMGSMAPACMSICHWLRMVKIFCRPGGRDGTQQRGILVYRWNHETYEGMTVITNPLVNSYKRLVPGYEAPIYVAWSATNRSPLIRIPVTRGAGTRVELRCPDPAANPYLVLAVCLEAGLDGIRNQITPPDAVTENVFEMQLPQRAKLESNLCRVISNVQWKNWKKMIISRMF